MKQKNFNDKFLNIAYSFVQGVASPINTAETYLTNCHLGFNCIKGDVQPTSDGELVMCHDDGFTLDTEGRITVYDEKTAIPICKLSYEQCKSLTHANEHSYKALGYHASVCGLEDLLIVCREYNVIPYITLREGQPDVVVPKVLELLTKYCMLDNCIINSFGLEVLKLVRQYSDRVTLSWVHEPEEIITKEMVDTALSLGDCYICAFWVPFANIFKQTQNSAEGIAYAQEKGVGLLNAQIFTYSDYAFMIRSGFSGCQLIGAIVDYQPIKCEFEIDIKDGVAIFNNTFSSASKYFATVIATKDTVKVSDIRKNGSNRNFSDGLPLWWLDSMNYQLSVTSEKNNCCTISYENNALVIKNIDIALNDTLRVLVIV